MLSKEFEAILQQDDGVVVLEDRQRSTQWIEPAHREGARLKSACGLAGIDVRTLQRWKIHGLDRGDCPCHTRMRCHCGEIGVAQLRLNVGWRK